MFHLTLRALTIGILATALPAPAQVSTTARNVPSDSTPGLKTPQAEAPRTAISPEGRGDIAMARKNYRQAIADYQEVQPSTAILLNKTGIAYHQLLELGLAKKYYEKALKANPKYAEAMNNLGTIYYAAKNYRRALNEYKKALQLDSTSASIYSNLGTAYFGRKDYKDAAEAWQHALQLDPDVFEHRGTHGVLLQERNVEERAKFHYYLAKMYAQSGVNDRALQYLRMALEEGLKERNKLGEEPEFASLRQTPEFKELLTLEPKVL
jgi:tetratricopeptide (TPR) repeat protein